MLSGWIKAGLSPENFWEQTPRTYAAIIKSAINRLEYEHDRYVALAWRTANFMRTDKLGPLSRYIGAKRKAKPEKISADDGLAGWAAYLKAKNKER